MVKLLTEYKREIVDSYRRGLGNRVLPYTTFDLRAALKKNNPGCNCCETSSSSVTTSSSSITTSSSSQAVFPCDYCPNGSTPVGYKLVFSGVVNDFCQDCASYWNHTWYVQARTACEGYTDIMSDSCQPWSPFVLTDVVWTIQDLPVTGGWRLRVTASQRSVLAVDDSTLFYQDFSDSVDCDSLTNQNIPLRIYGSGNPNHCDWSSATCVATAY